MDTQTVFIHIFLCGGFVGQGLLLNTKPGRAKAKKMNILDFLLYVPARISCIKDIMDVEKDCTQLSEALSKCCQPK